MTSTPRIPGLDLVASAKGRAAIEIQRTRTNLWWLMFGDGATDTDVGFPAIAEPPSDVLARLLGARRPATLCKVELDTCGAWVTVCNAEHSRPIVVRRAGWVDVRGQPAFDTAGGRLTDDRVGLGPGDAFVLLRAPSTDHADEPDETLLDALLSRAGHNAKDILAGTGHSPHSAAVVLAVPSDLGDDPKRRVALALGVEASELDLPGYPLGDLQPELWHEPPPPPRVARLRLRPDSSTVASVRQLLDRLLASWRLDGRVDEAALKLAASELATNAVLHGETPEAATVRYLGATLRIDVDDRSDVMPVPRDSNQDDLSGRGLKLVEALTADWGVAARPVGKRVWCEVAVSAGLDDG